MGDAILAVPSLQAIREKSADAEITFYANKAVRDVLTPNSLCDKWLTQKSGCALKNALQLRKYNFSKVILYKNSFASGFAVFLGGIPERIGYSRECRGIFLTERLYPVKMKNGKYKPRPMYEYYGKIAEHLGGEMKLKTPELEIAEQDRGFVQNKFGEILKEQPLIVIVPGGAFGQSKCWIGERFATLSDMLIEKYNAKVVVSAAPNPSEKKTSRQICRYSRNKLLNLAENPLTLGQLKALFERAELVISNDTGPRHIAIALGKKIITLFGPNNPEWTKTDYDKEVKIIGKAPCVPCDKPVCNQSRHLCMESITTGQVFEQAEKLMNKNFS